MPKITRQVSECPLQTLTVRLEQAVDAALSAADAVYAREHKWPGIAGIAESLYNAQPELMEEAKRPIIMERLYWLIKRRRSARRDERYHQLELPGIELPRTVFLKNGSRTRVDYLTATQIDEAVKVLEAQSRERQTPKIRRLRAAREVMERYLADNRTITWGDVKKREIERLDFERLINSSPDA